MRAELVEGVQRANKLLQLDPNTTSLTKLASLTPVYGACLERAVH